MKSTLEISKWLSLRRVFVFLSASIFILLPLLSIDAGISGDEPVHYEHAEYVYNYFKTNGLDESAINTPKTNLKYYGQAIDNLSYYINKFIGSNNPYLTRHILNAFLGALLILFSALTALSLSGYAAGILTIIFLLLSPRILGHSYNNLKDIPFALGYIMAIYGLLRAIISYPGIRVGPWIWMCLGLGIAFGTRAGGLILVPIFYFFIFLKWIFSHPWSDFSKWTAWKNGLAYFSLLLLVCAGGWIIALISWPYAQASPIKNSLESLQLMTHYSISIRQLFEGEWLWSENLPGYYPFKYIIITSPLVIIAGLGMQFLLWKKRNYIVLILLNFVYFFPLVWVVIKGSNLYGGWRHLLFIYPAIAVMAASSWVAVYKIKKSIIIKVFTVCILILGLAGPLIHIIRYHPVEYVYFNKLSGGINKAFSKYETDYYYHSLGPATRWLRQYLNENYPNENVKVASNFPLEPYFQNDENITPVYTHYFTRAKIEWNYGIYVNTFLGPDYLESENWPPNNSLYTFEIGEKVICSVVKRPTKADLQGVLAYRNSDFQTSIELFKIALEADPQNETAKLYLAWAYRQLNNFSKSNYIARQLLEQQPMNDMARDLVGRNYISMGEFESARESFKIILEQNYKYLPAYEQSSIAEDSLGNYKKAAYLLERGYHLGLKDKKNLERLVNYLQVAQYHTKAQKFRTILNKN